MSWILRAELIVLALVAIVVVIHAVNRRVLQLKYSLIWLLISRQEARIKRLIQILSIEHNELKGSEEEEDAATERDNK